MKIVIFGLAKSGTTALFYKIKNSLQQDTICLFEPRSYDASMVHKRSIKSVLGRRNERNVLAKVLPFRPTSPADVDSFSDFESKILIIRDPRDRLISRLLYGVYDSDLCRHDDKVKAFLEILKQKETDPESVSVKTLLVFFAKLNGASFSLNGWAVDHLQHAIRKPIDFYDQRSDLFLFKYEDMIDQRFASLEEHLEIPLKGEAVVAPELDRVVRTRGYDGWRHWFTAEDVDYLLPVMQPFLNRFYPDADWKLSASPSIPREHGSGYIERIVNDRRAVLKQPAFVSGYDSG
jgi:hypothetical protein